MGKTNKQIREEEELKEVELDNEIIGIKKELDPMLRQLPDISASLDLSDESKDLMVQEVLQALTIRAYDKVIGINQDKQFLKYSKSPQDTKNISLQILDTFRDLEGLSRGIGAIEIYRKTLPVEPKKGFLSFLRR